MKTLFCLSVLLLACSSTTQPDSPLFAMASQDAAYIVTVSKGANPEEIARAHGVSPRFVYRNALDGFAGDLPQQALDGLSRNPNVLRIEPDGIASIESPPWGLDRIDQRALPLNQTYNYQTDAAGVRAYIIDTGIRFDMTEFQGRAISGYDFIDNDPDASDCHGHGSHVAGTVGGATVGVARGVTLISVRVLSCSGSGTWSQVIAGIDWVTADAQARGGLAVANMSLGGSTNLSVNDAVTTSIHAGVVYAVSAGNNSSNACNQSPAGTPEAVTVGATDSTDTRASFSNYGNCVDLFAPGVNVLSVNAACQTTSCYKTLSGTSMASPHVAGVAAIYRALNPTATATQIAQALIDNATPGIVINPGTGSPNRLLYSILGSGPLPPPPPPPPPGPPVHVGDVDVSVTFSASLPRAYSRYNYSQSVLVHNDQHQPIAGVLVRYQLNDPLYVNFCTTDATGRCGSFGNFTIKKNIRTWTFSVIALELYNSTYLSAFNHDPDGDSNGTTLIVALP
jgi:subtilisin family serine protease